MSTHYHGYRVEHRSFGQRDEPILQEGQLLGHFEDPERALQYAKDLSKPGWVDRATAREFDGIHCVNDWLPERF